MTHTTRSMKKLEAANKLMDYAAGLSNYDEMVGFQNQYKSIVQEYMKSPFAVLSTGVFLEKLESFQKWLPELVANKSTVIPLLVSNMLQGDMFAESIYKEIYKHIGKSELVLDIYKILNNPTFESKYSENGRDGAAEAKINAEHWLVSQEAVDIFNANHHGVDALCYANELLEVHNNFINCENL